MGNRLTGESLIRFKARGEKRLQEKGKKVLRGITAALRGAGERPAYLYRSEPYSGVLLYDLGLEEDIAPHIHSVYKLLKSHGVEEIIVVDPHTAFMMKEIYPRYIENYDLKVRHYLEILSGKRDAPGKTGEIDMPEKFVMHDSCVMTRDLGIVEGTRKVAGNIGIKLLEPENRGLDTACCGGPVEYAFADLSQQISSIRIKELAGVCKDILVTCPICLINLMKYEQELGIRVWDMGELLYAATGDSPLR